MADRIFGLTILICVLLLVALAGWGLLSSFSGRAGKSVDVPTPAVAKITDFTLHAPHPKPQAISLLFHIQRLESPDRRIVGLLRVQVGHELLFKLYDAGKERYLFEHAKGEWQLNVDYYAVELRFVISDPSSLFGEQEIKVPLKYLYSDKGSGETPFGLARPFVIALRGAPQDYPDDRYTATNSIGGIGVPFKFGWRDRESGEYLQGLPPVKVLVEIDPSMAGKRVEYAIRSDPNATTVEITRDGPTRAYVYAIAAVPFVLAILLGRVWLFRAEGAPFQEVLVGLSAVLLTILPLRAVLVPPELSGLTRMDYLLGVELLLLLLVGVVQFLRSTWSSKPILNPKSP
jgi:hypothetical protein